MGKWAYAEQAFAPVTLAPCQFHLHANVVRAEEGLLAAKTMLREAERLNASRARIHACEDAVAAAKAALTAARAAAQTIPVEIEEALSRAGLAPLPSSLSGTVAALAALDVLLHETDQ